MNDGMEKNGEAKNGGETGAEKKRWSYTSRVIQSWKKTSGWNKVIVFLTAVIAVANVTYTIYARKQWQVANQTLTEIRNGATDTHALAVAATSAAEIADKTLRASGQSFKQEQRAYLWANSFNMASPPTCPDSRGTHVCADVHIVNSGRTPANGIHLWRYATFGPNAEQTVKAMKIPDYSAPMGDMLGTTGDKWGTAFTAVVDDATAQALIEGKISLYVYGVVQYFDIFGEYHETGFCSHRVLKNTPFIVCEGFGNWFDNRPEQTTPRKTKKE